MDTIPTLTPTLASIENFRDFGGFAVPGGRVQRGRLLRSAHLGQASDADLAALDALPLSAIVDLRRPSERRRDPSRRPPGFRGVVVESDDGDLGVAPHLEFLRLGDTRPEAVEAFLVGYYREAPFLPRHRDLFARAFAALDGAPGALLVHCQAGKDRTGLLVALIRTALGGDFDESLADFEATNACMITPERTAAAALQLQAIIGGPPSEQLVQGFLGVWSHHLAAAFRAIEAVHGSADGYLDSLGVDAGRRARLVEQLTA